MFVPTDGIILTAKTNNCGSHAVVRHSTVYSLYHVVSGAMWCFDCMTHAYTSLALLRLPLNASLGLCHSAIESAVMILVFSY